MEPIKTVSHCVKCDKQLGAQNPRDTCETCILVKLGVI